MRLTQRAAKVNERTGVQPVVVNVARGNARCLYCTIMIVRRSHGSTSASAAQQSASVSLSSPCSQCSSQRTALHGFSARLVPCHFSILSPDAPNVNDADSVSSKHGIHTYNNRHALMDVRIARVATATSTHPSTHPFPLGRLWRAAGARPLAYLTNFRMVRRVKITT